MLLGNKVAVITGSSQGIGKGIALRFAREGASVVINSRTPVNVHRTAEEIRAFGGTALEAPADVGVEAEAEALFQRTIATFGRVDILVNNAVSYFSDSNRRPFLQLRSADWNEFMQSNLGALFYCTQNAARIMARQGIRGSIINISSNGALRPHRQFIGYDSMKGAMDSFTRAVAVDLGPWGIRVNAIRPGRILIERSPQYNQPRPVRDPNVPLQRTGYPEDVAWAALFLASDEASFVTGQAFEIDGGLLTQGRSPCAEFRPVATPESIGAF
jgi:NAD(P)-dependent dehydrogenase (short-subunit alcohol dehydrogenase family)